MIHTYLYNLCLSSNSYNSFILKQKKPILLRFMKQLDLDYVCVLLALIPLSVVGTVYTIVVHCGQANK